MKVLERNFRVGPLFGGFELFPYQIAFGASVRWGEFRGVRLYLGPVKIWVCKP